MPSSCKDIRKPSLPAPPALYYYPLRLPLLPPPSPRSAPQTDKGGGRGGERWDITGAALADCLQHSECVLVQRHSASDCLRHPLVETLPTRCQQLKKGYADCRRGLLDMRKRFRGNYPAALSAGGGGGGEEEGPGGSLGGAAGAAGQLYAGRPLWAQTPGPGAGSGAAHVDTAQAESSGSPGEHR